MPPLTPETAFAQKVKEGIAHLQVDIEEEITCSIAVVLFRDDDTLTQCVQRSERLLNEMEELGGNLVRDDHALYEDHKLLKDNADKIIALLQEIHEKKREVKGTGYYKEIPISSTLYIDTVDVLHKKISVKVLNDKLLASYSHQIVLTCGGVSKFIKADVLSSMLSERTLVLHNFTYTDSALTQRQNVRIEPHKHIPVIILSGKEQLTGVLDNLSINSLRLEVDDVGPLKAGDEINVNFILSEDNADNTVHCNGRILSIQKGQTHYFAVVLLYLDAKNEEHMSSYISWRQMHIIKELQHISFPAFMPDI